MRALANVLLVMACLCGCDLLGSTVGDENILSSAGPHTVLERVEYFSERTYFYSPTNSFGDNTAYTQLFGSCPTDCSERLEQFSFAPDSVHFAFRIGNSSRYDSKTRLLLYDFSGGTVRKLLDKTDQTVTGYRFTDSTLVYTLGSGATASVSLD